MKRATKGKERFGRRLFSGRDSISSRRHRRLFDYSSSGRFFAHVWIFIDLYRGDTSRRRRCTGQANGRCVRFHEEPMHGAGKSAESLLHFDLVVRPYHQPASNTDVRDNCSKNRYRISANQLDLLVCRFLSNSVKYVEYEQRYFNFQLKLLPLRLKSNF